VGGTSRRTDRIGEDGDVIELSLKSENEGGFLRCKVFDPWMEKRLECQNRGTRLVIDRNTGL
jgi:hypothetical protein